MKKLIEDGIVPKNEVSLTGKRPVDKKSKLLPIIQDLLKRNDASTVDKDELIQECVGKLTPEEVEAELKKLIDDGIVPKNEVSLTGKRPAD